MSRMHASTLKDASSSCMRATYSASAILSCSICVIATNDRWRMSSARVSSKGSSASQTPSSPHLLWWAHYTRFRSGIYLMVLSRPGRLASIMHVCLSAALLPHSTYPLKEPLPLGLDRLTSHSYTYHGSIFRPSVEKCKRKGMLSTSETKLDSLAFQE